jgi:hypothetical protein
VFLILTEDRSGLAGSGSGDSFYQEVWMRVGKGVRCKGGGGWKSKMLVMMEIC